MRSVLLLVLVCLSTLLLSQDYFNKRLEFSIPWVFDGAVNALEIEDGYIINGVTGDPILDSWHRLAITKLDLTGEILWKKTWGDTVSRWYYADRRSLINHLDGYYTIGSKQSYYQNGSHGEIVMIKYNDNFDTLWTAYYGKKQPPFDTSYVARSFIGIENGFVVVGSNYPDYGADSYIILIDVDSLGNIIWEKNYGNNDFFYQGKSVIKTTDGGYAIGGNKFVYGHHGTPVGDPIIIKTDSLGNEEWELNLGGQYQDGQAILCPSADGNIIAVSRYDTDSTYYDKYLSRIHVSEISNDGVILSDSLYGDKHRYLRVSNCRTVEDDGIIVSGSVWNLTPNDMGYLLRISNDGDSLWYRQFAILYGQDSKNYFYDAIPVSDKGFLACGGCVPVAPDTGTQDAWVIKVDSLGCESPTYCWVGEEELEMPTSDQYLIIYPNPAWDKFTVSSQQSAVSNWQIAVYDMFGRKVEEIQVSKGKTKIVVNSMGWKKGLYIIRTMNKNGLIGSGKVIVK